MKYFSVLLLVLCISLGMKAQVKPVYFYGNQITNDKDKATSYAVYGKLSNEELWTFKRYDLYDNLLQTGSYKDEALTIPHGKFIFYMDIDAFNVANWQNFKLKGKTRFMSQQGDFVNGFEQGKWLLFYPDGSVLNIQAYKDGKLNGEFKTYDKLGNVMISGDYLMGERDGEWTSEKGTRKDYYENGVLKSTAYVKKTKKKKQ